MTVKTPIFPDLAGKTAVVTGGSKGIGAATCRALAENGVKVAVVARGEAEVDQLVAELTATGATAIGVTADCTSREALERMRGRVEEALGPTDILIPFAGGFRRATPILEISDEEWSFVVESNLTSTFVTTQVFLPGMIERGSGAIVTMASNAGRLLDITLTASYAAAKAGIVMFSRHVAKEVGPHGVRVNCVAPATTLTDRVKGVLDDERRAHVANLAPLGKIGAPEDSAYATLYLCSEVAGWITGITIDVAGGRIML
ncbi:MAG TPA: SDR family NAD(P)-dependent oxidoreductase [Gaiellaceae bacterium]|jgi:3-oxoacyl-[acyl-carrier protein] reductase|nr:SDR family NAD(P)-dependent oxidoreductase [Gaiellaceae bacterium]